MGLEGERKKGIDELGDLLVLCLLNWSSLLLHVRLACVDFMAHSILASDSQILPSWGEGSERWGPRGEGGLAP